MPIQIVLAVWNILEYIDLNIARECHFAHASVALADGNAYVTVDLKFMCTAILCDINTMYKSVFASTLICLTTNKSCTFNHACLKLALWYSFL